MKKSITRTMIVLIVLNLITAGQALAQDIVEEENQEVLEVQTNEEAIAQKKAEAEFAAQVAQKEAEIAEKEAQVAAKMAEKQAEIARKQIKEAKKQIEVAVQEQIKVDQKMKDLLVDIQVPNITLPHLPHFQQRGGGGGVLVIPSGQVEMENLAAITEDMNVMSRIFDKK
ncbi:MAG: hypothetical protein ACYS17_13320, partial [Planctomycetota bacterium]